jgi:hypothetical protein
MLERIAGHLDEISGRNPGTSAYAITELLAQRDPHTIHGRVQARGLIGRQALAVHVQTLYDRTAQGRFFTASVDGEHLDTSILCRPGWLNIAIPLGGTHERAHHQRALANRGLAPLDDVITGAAVARIAELLATGARIFDAQLYRLVEIDIEPTGIKADYEIVRFLTYALTTDLMELELVDRLVTHRTARLEDLPVRVRLLPTLERALDVSTRLCAGGPAVLFAAARPAGRHGRDADYVLLVQERSARVLNAAKRLAVIPKAFHQPLVDFSDGASLAATIEREFEEELLGRPELELAGGDDRHTADPLHESRLSEPMRWLISHPDTWRTTCTGFGINVLSGNYEFASTIVIDDERWWADFGGEVATNWEAGGIRLYSSREREGLSALVHDEQWSNEGLFSLLQGLRALARNDTDRVDTPTIHLETD